MSSEDVPLQYDMFSGQLVDARSPYRKQQDREREQLQQPLLFPIKDVLQFGVSARPWLKMLPAPVLALVAEDPRTPEEVERDLLREAQRHTSTMFSEVSHETPKKSLHRRIPAEVKLVGYRLRSRQAQILLRHRGTW